MSLARMVLLRAGVVAGVMVSGISGVWAQQSPRPVDLAESKQQLQRGVAAFQGARFEEARQIFLRLTALGQEHPLYTTALLLQAHCDFKLARPVAAAEALNQLLEANPKSRYADDVHLLLGMIAFKEGNYPEAASEFIWVMDRGQDANLKKRATEYAQLLFDEYLQPADMRRRLRREYLGADGLALVALTLARAELAQGRRAEGRKLIDEFLRLYPNTIFRKRLEQWDTLPAAGENGTVRVGVILPLTGVDTETGRALHRGLRFAQLNPPGGAPPVPVEFVVRDSESSMVGALLAAQLLLSDPTIVALIGEVDGAASGAIAALAQEKKVPLLIPVASDDRITQLGDHVFQMNATRDRKGRALAEYAMRYLNCRTFVTIAPQDGYGQQMTDGFSYAVDSLGGVILTQKWYYGQPQDLSRHFKAIRKAAFQRQLEDSLRMAGAVVDQKNRESIWRDYNLRFVRDSRNREGLVDALSTPVTNICGLFLPLYTEDIRLIAYQLNSHNIRAIALGGEYWQLMDLDTRKELQRHIDGTIFASDYYVDWENDRGRQFRTSFRKLLGATPDRFEVFGFDAGSLLIHCTQKGARRPDQFRRALAEISAYSGMKGEITLNTPDRVNRAVNILQFSGTEIRRVR